MPRCHGLTVALNAVPQKFEADPNCHDHPLVQEFQRSDINFQELLDTKISVKGQQVSDYRKRCEESKALIISLRKAVSELLAKRDGAVQRAVTMDADAREAAARSAARIAEVDANVRQMSEAMAASDAEIARMKEAYGALEAQLTECDAGKAAALTRNYELDKALTEEKAARAATEAMLSVREGELNTSRAAEREGEKRFEAKQMEKDKEVNDLRTQLGQLYAMCICICARVCVCRSTTCGPSSDTYLQCTYVYVQCTQVYMYMCVYVGQRLADPARTGNGAEPREQDQV